MLKRLLKQTQKKFQKFGNKKGSIIQKPYVFLLSFLRPLYYTNEFLILHGLKPKSTSRHGSIIFFSVHKSASTFIKNTIFSLIGPSKLVPLRFSGFLSQKKQEAYYNNPVMMKRILQDKGYFYGVFRAYYNFPGLERFKILLVLRDPRDVLTSQYFSVLYNHPLSRKEVFENRQKYAGISIDDFVLEYAPSLKTKYRDYCNHLIGRENVLFLKYEDMINDFDPWLRKLSSFLELPDNNELIRELVNKTSFTVKKEDPNSFIRNIKAGDHKNKLKPQTIQMLTDLFRDELNKLEYTAQEVEI